MPYKVLMFDLDDTLVIERAAESASFLASCCGVQEFGGDPEKASHMVQETARRFWEALPVGPWCDSIGTVWANYSGAPFPGDGHPDYEIRAFRELLKIMEM